MGQAVEPWVRTKHSDLLTVEWVIEEVHLPVFALVAEDAARYHAICPSFVHSLSKQQEQNCKQKLAVKSHESGTRDFGVGILEWAKWRVKVGEEMGVQSEIK